MWTYKQKWACDSQGNPMQSLPVYIFENENGERVGPVRLVGEQPEDFIRDGLRIKASNPLGRPEPVS